MRSKIPCAVPTFTQIDAAQDNALDWVKSDRAVVRRRQGIRDLRPRLEESSSFTSPSSPSIQPRAVASAIPSLSRYTLHRQRSDNSLRSKPRNFSRPLPSTAYAPSTPSPLKLRCNRGEVDTPSDYGSEAVISDTESIRERLILHKHKDSGVDIPESLTPISASSIAHQSVALRIETERSASVLSGIIDTYRTRDDTQSPTRNSSRTRSVQTPTALAIRRHEDAYACVCQICRQTRSRRRKKTMRLTKQVEQCKASMLAVRDPADPYNLERGEIYGLWLKLARLHVSYDNLISIPVVNIAEEEALFLAYMEVFNILTRLISLEKARWPEIEHTATKLSVMQNVSESLVITIVHS